MSVGCDAGRCSYAGTLCAQAGHPPGPAQPVRRLWRNARHGAARLARVVAEKLVPLADQLRPAASKDHKAPPG